MPNLVHVPARRALCRDFDVWRAARTTACAAAPRHEPAAVAVRAVAVAVLLLLLLLVVVVAPWHP